MTFPFIANLFNIKTNFNFKKTKSSPQRKETFHELCTKYGVKPLEMIQNVVTRWGSAHDMLERAIYLRKPIDAFVRDLRYPALKLSDTEWTQVEFVFNILLPLKATCMRLQQTSRPAMEKVFYTYETLFNELDRLSILAEDKYISHYLIRF
jgi:hypothetical protein